MLVPIFVKYGDYEYLLSKNSPCIDAGTPELEDELYDWHPKLPPNYENAVRSDMGAYGGPYNNEWFH